MASVIPRVPLSHVLLSGFSVAFPFVGLPPLLSTSGLRKSLSFFEKAFEKAIDRKWARTTEDQRRQTCEVQKITFVAWWPELGTGGSNGHELDRAEPLGQMDRKHGHQ